MPALATLDIAPADVRKGDVVLNYAGTLAPIATVDRKVKYVYLTDEAGKRIRWDIDAPVAVQRSVKTDEEKAAEQRAFRIEHLTREMERTLASTAAKIAKIAEDMAAGAWTDHWDIENLVTAQAERRIWAQVQQQVARIAKKTAEDPEFEYAHVTIADIVDETIADFTRGLINDAASGGSRSTSTMANACDDAERAAKAKFVRAARDGWL